MSSIAYVGLWGAFAVMALFVVYGFFSVRKQNKAEEAKMDAEDAAARKQQAAKHPHEHTHKHGDVE
jgi:beta-lactamase regulating signal transducer with metallopeptidase domain